MINTKDAALYDAALQELKAFKRHVGRQHRGRFTQIFLALKFYQNHLPSMFSGQFVSIELLQQMLDDLYTKVSRPANDNVLMLFEGSYLARTGIVGVGNKSPQNTWRNNLHLQKGVVCYAPPHDLADQAFLDQSRVHCRYLDPPVPGSLAQAKCSLCRSGGTYRREDHRKWLRVDPDGDGYAVVDTLNVSNFVPYVVANGNRVPLIPLMIAIYHWAPLGLVTGTRRQVDTADFASDFNFSQAELRAYFDDSTDNPHNAAIRDRFPEIAWQLIDEMQEDEQASADEQAPVPADLGLPAFLAVADAPAMPPQVNNGWDAEQYVASVLQASGWTTHDVSRQRVGYDLFIQRGGDTRYVDVKSSLGYCTPTLTAREWQQAQAHGQRYILAIIEDFSLTAENEIHWMPDPARAVARESIVRQFSISRTAWQLRTVPLDGI